MKQLLIIAFSLMSFLGAIGFHSPQATQEYVAPVNPLIGDISFLEKFGRMPDATTDEDLRISTHFEYVEAYLRSKEVPNLSPQQRCNREKALDDLHAYRIAGIYPRNHDYPGQRRPCFIDQDNRICGVGYLVEQSVGRSVAEEINRNHQYDRLLAMNDALVDAWIAKSGLTKAECAMIQPTYEFQKIKRRGLLYRLFHRKHRKLDKHQKRPRKER